MTCKHSCVRLLVILALFLAGCRSAVQVQALPVEPTPRLAIESAVPAEIGSLIKGLQDVRAYQINGRTYTTGRLAGHDVVLFSSGVSMVNAAMSTQTALDYFNVNAIVFTGIAGGVNPALNIGDVTVPAQWGQYQEQIFARQTEQGWDTGGKAVSFGNFGMMFPQPVETTRKDSKSDDQKQVFWFPADPGMLAAARQAAANAKLERCALPGVCLSHQPQVVVGGNGVSGPTFVDNAEYRAWVWQTFQADALDMETAAVAQVAYTNNVPYVAFRSLSDLAGGGPGANEMPTFGLLAARNSTSVLEAFLTRWKKAGD
jgi:adenosylhomocysteine nucleosidase